MKRLISRKVALRSYLNREMKKGSELTCVGTELVNKKGEHYGKEKVVNIGAGRVLVVQLHERGWYKGGDPRMGAIPKWGY